MVSVFILAVINVYFSLISGLCQQAAGIIYIDRLRYWSYCPQYLKWKCFLFVSKLDRNPGLILTPVKIGLLLVTEEGGGQICKSRRRLNLKVVNLFTSLVPAKKVVPYIARHQLWQDWHVRVNLEGKISSYLNFKGKRTCLTKLCKTGPYKGCSPQVSSYSYHYVSRNNWYYKGLV